MTPVLTLVVGVGMGEDARTEWLHAAWLALQDVPHDLLKRGAQAAMTKADHPSKIVRTIMATIEAEWSERKARRAAADQLDRDIAATVALTQEHRDRLADDRPKETTAEILARVWPTMAQHEPGQRRGALDLDPTRPCRAPTREDYLRMGVAPEHIPHDR